MDKLLDYAPCGLVTFTDNGMIISANQTLLDWLGYSKNELADKNFETLLTLSSRIFYNTHFFPLIKLHGKADEIFFSLLSREKKDIPVLSNSVRHLEGDNTYINCTVFIPIYQRRKYEDEILNARRAAEQALKENKDLEALTKDLEMRTRELDKQYQKVLAINQDLLQFSKIISHDLQEPIHKIQLFTNMLSAIEENEILSEKKRAAIRKINSAAERLKLLTLGLQQYVAVDSEKMYSVVNLNDVVQSAKARVVKERNFDDFQFITEELPSIEGFTLQLELLFYHLIDNAVKFRAENHDLMIKISGVTLHENAYRATPDKYEFVEHVKISFSDNGIGFDNQYSDYVFSLVKKINPNSKGIGIGLSLIKKIVENHGGTIKVHAAPELGTEFTITLPIKR